MPEHLVEGLPARHRLLCVLRHRIQASTNNWHDLLAAGQCRQSCEQCKGAANGPKAAFKRWSSMRPSRHRPLFNPLLQALRQGEPHARILGAGTNGSVNMCWVRGHGVVALKRSLTSNNTLTAEAEINRRIPPHPCIAQVGALQLSWSAQEGVLAACVSRSMHPAIPPQLHSWRRFWIQLLR